MSSLTDQFSKGMCRRHFLNAISFLDSLFVKIRDPFVAVGSENTASFQQIVSYCVFAEYPSISLGGRVRIIAARF